MPRAGAECVPRPRQHKKHVATRMAHPLSKFCVSASQRPTCRRVKPKVRRCPRRACYTRHVPCAPLKRAKTRIRLVGLCTLKVWCKCPAPFSCQTRKTSTQGGREDTQKLPAYPPSINLRNTEKTQMLKHMIVFIFGSELGLGHTNQAPSDVIGAR